MFKTIIVSVLLSLGLQANATGFRADAVVKAISLATVQPLGLSWTVGDSADYSLNGGIIQGTMHTFVREAADPGFWMEQDMDMGFLGKQKVEILINKDSGKVEQLLVNGEKQTPPDPSDTEIVDSHKDNIKVAKFPQGVDCFWVKVHSKKDNNDSQAWINPTLVPISGMIKTIAPSQLGDITLELTDFKKQ